ncbi:MAG: hypothetical protein AAFR38_02410 [Planctomycetota bacterium]
MLRAADLQLDAGGDAAALPARPGVLEFNGRTIDDAIAVVATGDLRAAHERRITPAAGRPDLREVVESVRAWVCGSLVEAEMLWLEIARERTPRTYAQALDRWRGWFIALDPESELPVWSRIDLQEQSEARVSTPTILGPMATKDAAKRYGRALDEVFELCREPELLAKRPNATACIYKEMGQCPAPCDGSEPMEAYRDRARAAVTLAREGPAPERARIEREIGAAAAETDFERAAALKPKLEQIGSFGKPAWRRVTTLDRFAVVLVQPSGRKGWARVLLHARGNTGWFADVRADAGDPGVFAALIDGIEDHARPSHGSFDLTPERAERIGLACHHLFHPGRGSGSVLDASVRDGVGLDEREFWRAARRAAKIEQDEADLAAGEAESGGG